jgi:hypothetical protein
VSWIIRYEPQGDVIWITTEGVHTLEDVRRMALDAVVQGKKFGGTRFLVDDRKMTPGFRLLDVYKLPRKFDEWGLPEGARVAIVYSGESLRKEDFRFLETAAGNFGQVRLRVFEESVDAALEWLADKA